MSFERPTELFDREREWADLAQFVNSDSRLAVVWGPRRGGKSTLLAALADATGGFYYEAVRQDASLTRAELGRLVGRRHGLGELRFDTWDQTVEALMSMTDCELAVIDEFGYLCEASPELPSVVQRVVDASRRRSRRATTRLMLCGSAIAQLSHLLDRDQPLFGRGQLALVVDAFDFRTAAAYWGVNDTPALAFLLHATLGGLPGYRDVVVDGPESIAEFDQWVASRVLAAWSPLLEEDGLVLQGSGFENNVYRSILTSVARGDRTPTGIATRTGRSASALARPIELLVRAELLRRVPDLLRARRSLYELADPFLVFHDAMIRPHRTRLRMRQQDAVWVESTDTWRSRILGPHFARLCREATSHYFAEFGLRSVTRVGATTVADPSARAGLEIDVIALDPDDRIVAIGEAKYTTTARGIDDLARLERARALLPTDRGAGCRIILFAANGANAALRAVVQRRPDVELVDLDRLYGRV